MECFIKLRGHILPLVNSHIFVCIDFNERREYEREKKCIYTHTYLYENSLQILIKQFTA